MRLTRLIVLTTALVGLSLAVATAPALASSTHLGAHLYGSKAYSSVDGHASYSACCGYREFDAGLWGAGKLAGKTLTVYAGGHKVGTMRVRSDGTCHLHHDTRNGQSVPKLASGATVAVKTGSGALVASGTLRRMMMM